MRTRPNPKVLCLGMSYPDITAQMEVEGFRSGILSVKKRSVSQVVECVRRNILTEMDGRDLARCMAMERKHRVEAYTVSQEMGSAYNTSRHLHANFNRASFAKSLRKSFGKNCRFQQIILDYFWIPTGTWVMTHWSKSFFQQTLPDLASFLEPPRENHNSVLDHGMIFLPFCLHVFKEIISSISVLDQYYDISFVRKSQLGCHALWSGTSSIDSTVMQEWFGKKINQEEFYCTFSKRDLYECMDDGGVTKEEVNRYLRKIEDVENVRMIRLKPLASYERGSGHIGGFIYSSPPPSPKITMTNFFCESRKVSDCSETDSMDSGVASIVEKPFRKLCRPKLSPKPTPKLSPKPTPKPKIQRKRPSLILETKTLAKKRRKPSIDNDKEETISEESSKKEDLVPDSKLYTIAEDLETYDMIAENEEVSSYHEISDASKSSLFPDFRRSYWDIINNEHVSRPHCMATIRLMNFAFEASDFCKENIEYEELLEESTCYDTQGKKYHGQDKVELEAAEQLLLYFISEASNLVEDTTRLDKRGQYYDNCKFDKATQTTATAFEEKGADKSGENGKYEVQEAAPELLLLNFSLEAINFAEEDVLFGVKEDIHPRECKIQEAAAKLLLFRKQVQLYTCVHPKVVEYEDKEEIDMLRLKICAEVKCSKQQEHNLVKVRERASLLSGYRSIP
mmetsp:Transcript_15588/g.23942  ORF Transcript_15588/g.23942 Transcript_15588/m.23942 type:complete len:680 (+) Transcript_15588:91-2130(+)